jgi:valacyclovir hydrolase
MRAVYGGTLDALWDRYVGGQEALFQAGGDLYRSLLGKVKCPTFVLHGAQDPLTPAPHAEAIHRAISGSRLYIFPDGKHNIHIRYAGEFNRIAHAFLSEPDRS